MNWKRPSTAILSALCLSLLSSCATVPSTPQTVKPDPLPANLMQPCPKLERTAEESLPYRELIEADLEVIRMYGECAASKQALIDAAKTR